MRNQKEFDTDLSHDLLVAKASPKLSYNPENDFESWKKELREKFIELSGLDEIEKNTCPINLQIEWEEDKETYRLMRLTFESEPGETVPCYLLIPKTGKKKYPVAITLQGHSTGFHNSIGELKYPNDERYHPRGRFALQAVENGFIALAIEQRGMGERKPRRRDCQPDLMCRHQSMVALGLGRTLLGERIWDVHRAVDMLAAFPECDLDKILITGNSGGGTATYYSAVYDERLKLCVPSCSFCPYKESILTIAHCNCNYMPFAYKYFDMQDLSSIIAPRNLIVITGVLDTIFPIDGVRRGFETVKKIYQQAGVPDNCRIIETPKAHMWCEDYAWPAINEVCEKLGWK